MADYWKSNDKKYCDFCKCWLADNKVSISLHENGNRHKANVAKKITDINKKSAKDMKIRNQLERDINIMERNAMAAYMKDIQDTGDLTSQLIREKINDTHRSRYPTIKPENVPESSKKNSKWQEAKADDCNIYYWNTETNDVSWDPPAEGYISLADLNKPEFKARAKQRPPNIGKKGKGGKKFNKPPLKKPEIDLYKQEMMSSGPLLANGLPFGKWKKVEVQQEVDLQLPEQRARAEAPKAAEKVVKEKEFKEKQITSLEDNDDEPTAEIGFKKRKMGNNKRNVRQRLEED